MDATHHFGIGFSDATSDTDKVDCPLGPSCITPPCRPLFTQTLHLLADRLFRTPPKTCAQTQNGTPFFAVCADVARYRYLHPAHCWAFLYQASLSSRLSYAPWRMGQPWVVCFDSLILYRQGVSLPDELKLSK